MTYLARHPQKLNSNEMKKELLKELSYIYTQIVSSTQNGSNRIVVEFKFKPDFFDSSIHTYFPESHEQKS